MSHTLTNIEKEINSYLFPCPPQLRWKSHRPPSHRHTPCFIGSSLQVFLHRHTPCFIGSSLQVFLHWHTPCFIGSSLQASSLPSSASTITPPTSSATPESKSTFPSTTTSYRQPSLQAGFHRLSEYTVTFPLPISPLRSFWHVQKTVSTHAPQFRSIKPLMLRNLLQITFAFARLP